MNASLALGEQLSPELVLVLPPELRAQVLAHLPNPAWSPPRERFRTESADDDAVARNLGRVLVSRAVHLAGVFAAITILTLAMSLVAQAVR
jgi:hypothetical protein